MLNSVRRFNDEWHDDNSCFNLWSTFCRLFSFGDSLCGAKLFWVIYVKNKDQGANFRLNLG